LPEKSGVYIFKEENGKIVYIGKAKNLRQRIKQHLLSQSKLKDKKLKIDFILVESEFEGLLLEASLIKKYQPKYNVRLKDDKSPLYIKITEEKFPRVFPARKNEGGYGPYPQAKTVRTILKFLRRIFPYRSCKKIPKKPCLYFHLKLCPGVCINQSEKDKKNYQKTIKHLKNLLERKSSKVIKELKKEMNKSAENEEFEKAREIRDKVSQIEWLIQKRHLVDEYLENPYLLEDIRQRELKEVKKILNLKKIPKRIEGFDISNILGGKASGGMVVFLDGEPEKSLYRRFKIKTEEKPNDIAMIKEVISRRLKHKEWEMPNLILVDGGKGQVKGAMEILRLFRLKIPVVGLAKKLEILIFPKIEPNESKLKFKEIKLPNDSLALNLLKRIRDEAHRFAHLYHLKLRALV